jgi:5-methylcytosine-specific restriction protein A
MSELHNKSLWHRRARAQLRAQPLCEWCLREGRAVVARIADRIMPRHNDPIEFWRGKLQSLCAHCHDSRKKFVEHRGFNNTIGADGMPIDPRHPVYRRHGATKPAGRARCNMSARRPSQQPAG